MDRSPASAFSEEQRWIADWDREPRRQRRGPGAKFMLYDAAAKGLLLKNTVIIEPTSGNTHIGLTSMAANQEITDGKMGIFVAGVRPVGDCEEDNCNPVPGRQRQVPVYDAV